MSNEGAQPDITGNGGFRRLRARIYRAVFFGCAVLSIATTLGIILVLLGDAVRFFGDVPVLQFLAGPEFSPSIKPRVYGVLPLLFGTIIITVGAAFVALPVGLLTATYLSEYAGERRREVLKPMLEVLAGVPTVVYGFFALVYVTPMLGVFLSWVDPVVFFYDLPELGTFNALSASLVMGIMIIPMVSSISEDAMSAVPDSLRDAGYGLGGTKFDISTTVVIPAAISGIASSFILAISRAIGETMIVVVASGMSSDVPEVSEFAGIPYVAPGDLLAEFFESTQTMTSAMVELGQSDLSGGTVGYKALFAIGLLLFVLTLVMNLISDVVTRRYREEYD